MFPPDTAVLFMIVCAAFYRFAGEQTLRYSLKTFMVVPKKLRSGGGFRTELLLKYSFDEVMLVAWGPSHSS